MITYHPVNAIGLIAMDGLQVIEAVEGNSDTRLGRLLGQADYRSSIAPPLSKGHVPPGPSQSACWAVIPHARGEHVPFFPHCRVPA